MPKHVTNLLVLMVCFLLVAFAAKSYLTDPSFYRFGHYRADAVPELAAGEPLFRGGEYCLTCHTGGQAEWAIGAHRTVECEVCHGASREHPGDTAIRVPADTIRLCATCHEAMPARPAMQPQIVVGEHPFAEQEQEQCHTCHDPHSPGDLVPEAAAPGMGPPPETTAGLPANAPAGASKCAKCHGTFGEGVKKNPPLAGLESAVFIDLLNQYRNGEREHRMMAKLAQALSDEEAMELARYYESLPGESPD